MFRRERDTRRTAKAVRDHSLTMEAFGRASLANTQTYSANGGYSSLSGLPEPRSSYSSIVTWRKPEGVRKTDSISKKIDDQKKKGLITQGEAEEEKLEQSARKGNVY